MIKLAHCLAQCPAWVLALTQQLNRIEVIRQILQLRLLFLNTPHTLKDHKRKECTRLSTNHLYSPWCQTLMEHHQCNAKGRVLVACLPIQDRRLRFHRRDLANPVWRCIIRFRLCCSSKVHLNNPRLSHLADWSTTSLQLTNQICTTSSKSSLYRE